MSIVVEFIEFLDFGSSDSLVGPLIHQVMQNLSSTPGRLRGTSDNPSATPTTTSDTLDLQQAWKRWPHFHFNKRSKLARVASLQP